MAESTGTAFSHTPIFNLHSQGGEKVLMKAGTSQSLEEDGRNPLPLLRPSEGEVC